MYRFKLFYSAIFLIVLTKVSCEPHSKHSRIVNGQLASSGQFPWQAAILLKDDKDTWFCSGSIIGAQWILTASHCILGAKSATVSVGTTKLFGSDANRQQVQHVSFTPRPDFESGTLANDIGLIKVTPITLNSHVRVIPLANDEIGASVLFTTSGWGSTSDKSSDLSDNLAYVSLSTISNVECKQRLVNVPIHDGMVCARSTGNAVQSTCDGDSGGPAVINPTSNAVLVGVVCFASNRGCESGDPSGFTRVAYYRKWIQTVTGI